MPDTLMDRFGRVHTDLRVSVTDRCNIRCFYCMPEDQVTFLPRSEILSFEEITRFVRVASGMGVRKVRITGGEPLVRRQLDKLVGMLSAIPGIEDIALTTNGLLLAQQARALLGAGLERLNISLDALDREKYKRITRYDGCEKVLEGIFEAKRVGFTRIKINAVAIRNLMEDEILPLVRFARQHDLEMRFIEYMPLDADDRWGARQVFPGREILDILSEGIGALVPMPAKDPSQPATDYEFRDGKGRIGFINPVTQPFCDRCNRLRLTAEGRIRNCLFSTEEWDARKLMRGGGRDEDLARLITTALRAKKAGHGINTKEFVKPKRAMYQIGG